MAARSTQLLDRHQASQFLNISHRRLSDPVWRRRFNLPTVKVGGSLRFDLGDLRQWLEARREKPGGGEAA
jgi:hypothetical protein